ncbi:MAG: hypothetical protein ACXVB9_22505 [Bdellovibrionota bacterium]
METSSNHWLPLTEYALRSGMSISTLRRKIKSNTIEYKMEEGRYLIRSDDLVASERTIGGFASSDQAPRMPTSRPVVEAAPAPRAPEILPEIKQPPAPVANEMAALREEFRRMQEDNNLRWRALEARVSGIVKKLEFFSEQMAEAKMLVKLFEEKLDHRA